MLHCSSYPACRIHRLLSPDIWFSILAYNLCVNDLFKDNRKPQFEPYAISGMKVSYFASSSIEEESYFNSVQLEYAIAITITDMKGVWHKAPTHLPSLVSRLAILCHYDTVQSHDNCL